MPIRFACPACMATLSIASRKANAVIECPKCNAKVKVPEDKSPVLEGILVTDPPAAKAEDVEVADTPFVPTPSFLEPPTPRPPVGLIVAMSGLFLSLLITGFIVLRHHNSKTTAADQANRQAHSSRPQQPGPSPEPRSIFGDRDEDDALSAGRFVFGMVLLVLALGLYVLPSVIAYYRGHPNFAAIVAVNLLLGVIFIGWVAALVWALTEVRSRESIHYHYDAHPNPVPPTSV